MVEPAQVAALVGLTAALVGTLFPWLRISSGLRSQTASGWSGDAQYRFADWFALNAPLDALLVLVLAGVGIYLILGRLLGSNVPAIPYGVAGAGAAIALVGILNWIYIDSESTRVINPSLDIGFGVYLLILGGAVAAFAGYQDVRRDAAVRRTEFIDTP